MDDDSWSSETSSFFGSELAETSCICGLKHLRHSQKLGSLETRFQDTRIPRIRRHLAWDRRNWGCHDKDFENTFLLTGRICDIGS